MSYSRRQLYAMGEPLGDSATYRKADGGLVLGGGGGGSSQPSSTTQTQDLPEWARGYAKDVLAKGAAVTDTSQNPYTSYTGNRVAGLSDLQKSAVSQTGPQGFQNTVGQYMNPYLQMSLAPQIAEANRSYNISGANEAAKATSQNAFGGSRQALMQAENERNRNMGLANIVGQGYNNAYGAATQQYNTGLGQQLQVGGMQQAQEQKGLDTAYQDFLTQKNYPYQQLSYMSNLIRGTPMGMNTSSQVYQSPGSLTGQLAGLGMGAYGLSRMAEGGMVDSYADGGSVESTGNIENIVSKLSDTQLEQAMKAAQARGDAAQIQIIQAEVAMRASERNGMAGAFNSLPQEEQDSMTEMAGGGVVAFADTGLVTDPMGTGAFEIMDTPKDKNAQSIWERITNEPAWKSELRREQADKASRKVDPDSPYSAKSANLLDADDAKAYAEDVGKTKKAELKAESKGVGSVVGQAKAAAKAAGIPAETFEAQMKRLRKEFEGEDAGYKKEMLDQYKKATDRLAETKSKAGYEALAQFGFNMAAQASKPGQARRPGLLGALESAGAASPTLIQSLAESKKLNRAAEDNLDKLRMDQLRFEQSLSRSDRQSALQSASAIAQDKKNQDLLDIERQKLGLMGQQYANAATTPLQKIADDLQRADPSLDRRGALNEASKMAGYSYRQDAANQARLAETIRKINEDYKIIDMMPPNDPMARQMRASRDQQIDAARRQLGGDTGMQAGVTIPQGITIEKRGG